MSAAREARKTVTILFCDLVHSTGLAEGDPETYRRTQERFFEKMRAVVERHGGTVEKFIGDEVMAVCGVPIIHEDDALRRHLVEEVDREAPALARRLHAPIVGRADELGLLQAAFERAVDESSCRLFTVLGPAGIGKSRLATELVSSVGERATAAWGRCLPYGEGITYWPLTEVARGLEEDVLGLALAA